MTDIRPQQENSRSTFVSKVAHDLRNPLTSIRGSLGLVAGGVGGEIPAPAKKLVEIAIFNCERLVQMLNELVETET